MTGEFDQPQAKAANVADPLVALIERMRKVLQEEADEKGTGEVVSWATAESVTHQYLADEEYHRAAKAAGDSTTKPRSPRSGVA